MGNGNSKPSKASYILQKMGIVKGPEKPITAEECFYETTHGEESYIPVEERIREKQREIECTIKSKFVTPLASGAVPYHSFFCTIEIEEDLISHAEEVLSPFVEGGFDIVNLSAKLPELINEQGVFYISWKNAYKTNKEQKNICIS